jgi:serine/threonine protein kinase
MSLQLYVIAGPEVSRSFILHEGDGLMLGRAQQAYYRLNDPRVSRNHCQVVRQGDRVTVIDNGGSGGVLVNGKPVKKHTLELGDVLQVGDSQLRLQVGDYPVDVALATAGKPPAEAGTKAAASLAELEALSGQTLSHYEVGPIIGRGSTSIVFQANDSKDNRPVALKVLLPEFSEDEEEVQRFIRAMKTMLPLRHPNLVTLYGAGRTGPYCWVAMEYIAGENMREVIGRIGIAGMLDWRYGYKVALHVARALVYAYGQQIIHRNVTPTNILLETPTRAVKLGDLMLAKALEGALARQITRPGELLGDVTYMSPERTRGLDVDGRSDLYGLGATVYALLTGRPPFEGASLVEKIARIRQDEPVKLTKYQMSIPSRFEGVVLRLLAKKPDDRYQSAEELLKELDWIGKTHSVTA